MRVRGREGGKPLLRRFGERFAERTGGYSREELASIPVDSNLGVGCANPTAIGALLLGETVVDLGSGGGIDCFLVSRRVGPRGRVIGVDMTPEMIDRARLAAAKGSYTNTEFRLGEIENLPVAGRVADVVISNCVINLSPDKQRVFREAFRVLKPGGRCDTRGGLYPRDPRARLRRPRRGLRAGGRRPVRRGAGPRHSRKGARFSREELRRMGETILSVELKATK